MPLSYPNCLRSRSPGLNFRYGKRRHASNPSLCVVLRQEFPGKRGISLRPFRPSRVIIFVDLERLFLVNFVVKIHHRDLVALVEVSGHLTLFEVGALRDSIQSLLKEKRKNILLNLSGLVYLDSSGIGELARIYVNVVKQGGTMKVIGLSSKVQEVLKITHLSQIFQEFPDEQSALRSFPPIPQRA
jgi:anti-sigma B factor antagonist